MLSSYYYTGNWIRIYKYHRRLINSLYGPEIILVHQMGKVGSSSIVKSLEKAAISQPIIKTHFLNPQTHQEKWRHINLHQKYPHNRKGFVPRHLIVGRYLSRQLPELLAQNKRIKVITAVRDPIARGISSFFQNVNQYIPDFMQKFESQKIEMGKVAEVFWQEASERRYRHNQWFEQEFKSVFDIDVFSIDFPKPKGYLIKKSIVKNIDLLIVKLENFNFCLEKSLQEFLDIDKIVLVNSNMSQNKNYDIAYQQFKTYIKFSPEYIDNMYETQFARHFYSDEQISSFKLKWAGQRPPKSHACR